MIMQVGAALSIAILLVSPCFAQDRASQKFLKEAIEGNFAEVHNWLRNKGAATAFAHSGRCSRKIIQTRIQRPLPPQILSA
jgi:hypothetical protein